MNTRTIGHGRSLVMQLSFSECVQRGPNAGISGQDLLCLPSLPPF